jgi:S-adenosylmethionine hydrolase
VLIVTFLSDFGLEDPFVGICHGVIKSIAPQVDVVDVTHGVSPQAVLEGALLLADALPYLPPGVHLAVVDPGVGTARRPVVLRSAGRLFVGPDNGLLTLAADRSGGLDGAWEIGNSALMLDAVSRTFHGRDVFAPVAAHLAVGTEPSAVGPAIDPAGLVRLAVPEAEADGDGLVATVLLVDRFGNLRLNLEPPALGAAGSSWTVEGRPAAVAATYGDDEPAGALLLHEDSAGAVAVAVAGGSAAAALGARPGSRLRLRPG